MASEATPSAAELAGGRRARRASSSGRAHAAVDAHPLRHPQAQVARHQRRGLRDADVVELVLALAPDLQGVAEALVVMSPVRAPLRSITALVNSVVACTRRPMSDGAIVARPAAAGRSRPSPRGGIVVRRQLLVAHLAAGRRVVRRRCR